MSKKRLQKPDESSECDGRGVSARDPRVVQAIENVFRLTHKRDMTLDERQMFGLAQQQGHKSRKKTRPEVAILET